MRKILYTLPVPSTSFLEDAYFCGKTKSIIYEYIHPENELKMVHGNIKFSMIKASQTRGESACSLWHIENCYDQLVEVLDSKWLQEILNDTNAQWRHYWDLHHYMIYLDSTGCFEFIATGWEISEEMTDFQIEK